MTTTTLCDLVKEQSAEERRSRTDLETRLKRPKQLCELVKKQSAEENNEEGLDGFGDKLKLTTTICIE